MLVFLNEWKGSREGETVGDQQLLKNIKNSID